MTAISIFQILFLILALFKGTFILLLNFEYTTYRNYKEKSGGIISLQIWLTQICEILPMLITKRLIFWFVKANPECPDFLFHALLIQELSFVLVYILARYHTYQGEFFASEVAHFLAILKSAIDGSF